MIMPIGVLQAGARMCVCACVKMSLRECQDHIMAGWQEVYEVFL